MPAALSRIHPARVSRSPLALGSLLALGLWPAAVLAQTASTEAGHASRHRTHHAAHEPSHGKTAAGHATANRAAPRTPAHAPPHGTAHKAGRVHPDAAHHPQRKVPVVVPPVAPKPVPAASVAPVAPAAPLKGSSSGLPLPRFASLRADAVNLRGGPGTRYPIQWVYKRRDLPVTIEREFDVWRLIEDSDGVKGWVHQATLVGTRTFVIPGETPTEPGASAPPATEAPAATGDAAGQPKSLGSSSAPTIAGRMEANAVLPPHAVALRASPQPDGGLVAVLMPGIVGRIRSCAAGSGWCKVSVRDYSGWLPRSAFWGLLPDETILPP